MKTSRAIVEWRGAYDHRILALLSQGPKDKIWTEREIIDGLGEKSISICALERLQAAGKVKLTFGDHPTYLTQLLSR
jgi:hypothetical protein